MYEIIFTPNNQAVYILIDFLRHFRFQNRRSHEIETPKEEIITPFGQILSAFYFSESPFRCGFVKEYLFDMCERVSELLFAAFFFQFASALPTLPSFQWGGCSRGSVEFEHPVAVGSEFLGTCFGYAGVQLEAYEEYERVKVGP